MSNRQKFWLFMTTFSSFVALVGWMLGHWFGWTGTPLGILFGLVAGSIAGALIPLEWEP